MKASYGFFGNQFGISCIAFSEKGILALVYETDSEPPLQSLKNRFPKIEFTYDQNGTNQLGEKIFGGNGGQTELILDLIGTEFQLEVWNALLQIPIGMTTTYAEIAKHIGRPKAVRAVGTAIGQNPIAYLIPCHRVVRTDGSLGGYRWGLEIKKKMLAFESSLKANELSLHNQPTVYTY